MPTSKDQKGLRQIMKEASKGNQADQSEISGAVGKSTQYILPFMIFFFTVELASALSLYWFTSGFVAYIQQSIALREDETELEDIADKPTMPSKDVSAIPEAEVIDPITTSPKSPKPKIPNRKKSKKRRKK
jgi:membrane protein insertase Oxa1/YidC/SpoIIIJ